MLSLPNVAFLSNPGQIASNTFAWGIGVFSYVNAKFNFNHSILVPSLNYRAEVTGLAAVPLAYRFESLEAIRVPGKLSLGANFKYIYRGKAEELNMSVAEFEDIDFPFQTGDGYGLDLGMIYHLNPRWNFGMQLADAFYTSIEYEKYTNNDNPPNQSQHIRGVYALNLIWAPPTFPKSFITGLACTLKQITDSLSLST